MGRVDSVGLEHTTSAQWTLPARVWPCVTVWLTGVQQQLTPPTALPRGRRRSFCTVLWLLALFTFKNRHCQPTDFGRYAAMLVRNDHWLQVTAASLTTEPGLTLSVPSIGWMNNWPLLGEQPIFKTSLTCRVYTTHSHRMQTLLQNTPKFNSLKQF